MRKNRRWSCSDGSAGVRAERRDQPRRAAHSIPGLGAAAIVAGPEVRLLNISRAGVLLESARRLSTGSHICLRLHAADAIFLLKGRVLRSKAVTEGGGDPRYESAVAFDEDFVLLDQALCEKAESGSGATGCWGSAGARRAAGAMPVSPRLEGGGTTILAEAFLARRSGADLRRLLDLKVT